MGNKRKLVKTSRRKLKQHGLRLKEWKSLQLNKPPETMESSNPETVLIKVEPEIKEEEKEVEISTQEIDIEVPDIKIECSNNVEESQQTEGPFCKKFSFTRKYLLDIWLSVAGTDAKRSRHVLQMLSRTWPNMKKSHINNLKNRVASVCKEIVMFWKKCNCSKKELVAKYSDWLNVTEEIEILGADKPNRKKLAYLPKVDTELSNSDLSNTDCTQVSADEALSLITEAQLTKHQYLLIKEFVNTHISANALPSYQEVLEAKERPYPLEEIIIESSAKCAEGGIENFYDESVAEYDVELQGELRILEDKPRKKAAGKSRILIPRSEAFKLEIRREEIKRRKQELAKQTARRILEDVLQVDMSVAGPSTSTGDTECDAEPRCDDPEMLEEEQKIAELQQEQQANMTVEEREIERLKWTAYKCERRRYMNAVCEQKRKEAKRKANERRKLVKQEIKESIKGLKRSDVTVKLEG